MDVFKSNMALHIDPVPCGTKESPLAGPPEEVAAAKKEVQDQIKQKQAELQALQQQLTQIK